MSLLDVGVCRGALHEAQSIRMPVSRGVSGENCSAIDDTNQIPADCLLPTRTSGDFGYRDHEEQGGNDHGLNQAVVRGAVPHGYPPQSLSRLFDRSRMWPSLRTVC